MRPIRIALTKGRLEDKTVEMLERLGYDCTNVREKGGDRPCKGSRCCHLCRDRRLRHGRGRKRHHHGKRRHLL